MSSLRPLLRRLWRAPVYAGAVIASIALGIAVNCALFSQALDVYWRELPLAEPGRLAIVWSRWVDGDVSRPTAEEFQAWAAAQSFEKIGALRPGGWALTDGVQPAERVRGGAVSADLPAVFRFQTALGRGFLAEDFAPGAPRVAVLSWRYWQRRFGGDPAVLGRDVTLNQVRHTVVGVWTAASTFAPDGQDVMVPLVWAEQTAAQRAARALFVLARLAPGVTRTAAQSELDVRMPPDAAAGGRGAAVRGIDEWIGFQPEDRRTVLGLALAMAGVQLIVCANLAGLLLARTLARRKEWAVRAALGAEARHLGGEMLREAVVLALAGGVAGVVLAGWAEGLLRPFLPQLPMGLSVQPAWDVRVPLFGLGAALLSGLVFGWLPAWAAARANVTEALGDSGRGASAGRMARRWGAGLVVGEMALAGALLSSAGQVARSVAELRRIPLGFEPDGVAAVGVTLPPSKYSQDEAIVGLARAAVQRAQAVPGVAAATVASRLPLRGYPADTFAPVGWRGASPAERPRAVVVRIGPDYERVLGVPLRQGRGFTAGDRAGTARVALVNRRLAETVFPDGDVVGRRIVVDLPGKTSADGSAVTWEIVGVLGNVKARGDAYEDVATLYLPLAQAPVTEWQVLAKVPGGAEARARELRAAIAEIDRDVLADRFETMTAAVAELRRRPEQQAWLLGGFAVVAGALAAIGVYGVSAAGVTQRTRELGIRLALGAGRGRILRLVLGEAALLVAAGVVASLALSLAAGAGLQSAVFGLERFDPVAWAVGAAGLGAAAGLATAWPAWRALRVDPMTVLRAE